ncbi:MAG: PDC sensor domain-containing protein [Rectinemataceae bacterium]
MKRIRIVFSLFLVMAAGIAMAQTQSINAEQKARVEAWLVKYQTLGSDSTVIAAVKAFNAQPPAELSGMTQDKWAALGSLSPEVRNLSKNALAEYLKAKREPVIAELFVSGATGTKVAFFGKTTSWNHSGKPKHDVPMSGKTWMGPPELDESSGRITVQISFPILDGKKAIGTMVIGLDVAKL